MFADKAERTLTLAVPQAVRLCEKKHASPTQMFNVMIVTINLH